MKKIACIAVVSCSLLLCSGLGIGRTIANTEVDKKQIFSSKEIVNQLTYWHYSKHSFNDNLSQELFDNYLKRLDARKQVLLQSDIDEFSSYKSQLDNDIKKGDLNFSYLVFNRYKDRLKKQLDRSLKDWPAYIENFNFAADENILIDRENAPWPKTQAEADDLWRKQMKANVLALELSGKDSKEIQRIFKKRLERQLVNLEKQNNDEIFQIYMNALTELYDPHTNYLSPESSETFNINMSLKLEGIGAVLQNKDEEVSVARLVPAGPADKQGELKPNDRIIAVGQNKTGELVDVVGWQLDDVVNLIRGKPKSIVRLEVTSGTGNAARTKVIEIVRDTVRLEEQSAKKAIINIPDGAGNVRKVGIINIPAFYMDFDGYRRGQKDYKSTTRDVAKLIDELERENVSGIIIDLRENGGGSLYEAQELTSLFIEQGPVVQIRYINNSISYKGKPYSSTFYKGPVAVLIDRLSASASEIFAAAIQDYQRGLIIGNQSYGKGTVQTLKELPYGQLKITESKFYRVSGDSTQHRGVMPDIQLPAIYDTAKIGESTLEHALQWDKIPAAEHATYTHYETIINQLKLLHDNRAKQSSDFAYQNAMIALNNKEEKYLSLNKKQRQEQNKTEESQILNIENKRRKQKGTKLLSSFEELEKENEEKANKKTATTIDTKNDFYLLEAGKILLDSNMLITSGCKNKTLKKCDNPVIKTTISRTLEGVSNPATALSLNEPPITILKK